MRRHYSRPPVRSGMHGRELTRLMTMFVMLGVLYMLMVRARDPSMWKYFAGEAEQTDEFTMEDFAARERRANPRAAAAVAAKAPENTAAKAAPAAEAQPAAEAKPSVEAQPAAEIEPAVESPARPDAAPADAALPARQPGFGNSLASVLAAPDEKPEPTSEQPSAAPEQPAATAEKPASEAKPTPDAKPGDAIPAAGDKPAAADKSPLPDKSAAPGTPAATDPPAPTGDAAAKPVDKPADPAKPIDTSSAFPPDKPEPDSAPSQVQNNTTNKSTSSGDLPDAPAGGKPEPVEAIPIDKDPEEVELIKEEFQAISDKQALAKEDMFAYWRLARWQKEQTIGQLAKRARRDLLFTHMAQDPDKCRGELIRLRLHVKRTVTYESEENIPGVKRMYEVWGNTDEAGQRLYCCVLTDIPDPKFPLGPDLYEEGLFYGYFLKLLAYEAKDEKHRFAPLLIGKMTWIPRVKAEKNENEWVWALYACGALVIVFGLRYVYTLIWPAKRKSQIPADRALRLNKEGEEIMPIESWLDRVEEGQPVSGLHAAAPTNGTQDGSGEHNGEHNGDHRANGNSGPRRLTSELDWDEET